MFNYIDLVMFAIQAAINSVGRSRLSAKRNPRSGAHDGIYCQERFSENTNGPH